MFFGGLFWLILLALIVMAVVSIVRSQNRGAGSARIEQRSSALSVLEERYARGEIQRDEFLEKKKDIGG